MLEDSKNTLSKPLNFLYHFFLHTLLFWGIGFFLLSWFWGEHVHEMAKVINSRSEYLQSLGIQTSLSLKVFHHLNFTHQWGVGSLYSFFFLNFPFALLFALQESTLIFIPKNKHKWGIRICFFLIITFIFHPFFSSFSNKTFSYSCFLFLLFITPILISHILYQIHTHTQLFNAKKHSFIALFTIVLCLSPYITHPVWHIIFKPKTYSEINSKTLIRDWFLLNENGENQINEWYYQNSPIASESERVTIFQPLLVGTFQLNLNTWKKELLWGFSQPIKGHPGQRIRFIKFNSFEEAHANLKKGLIDYLCLDSKDGQHTLKTLKENELNNSTYGYFTQSSKKSLGISNEFNYSNFLGQEIYWGEQSISSSPLMRRVNELRTNKYNLKREVNVRYFKKFIGSFFSNSKLSSFLILGLGLSLAALCLRLFSTFSKSLPTLYLFFVALVLWRISPVIAQNFNYWNQSPESTYSKIFHYHQQSIKYNENSLKNILKTPIPEDRRLAMWVIQIIGSSYQQTTEPLKLEIKKRLFSLKENYHKQPVNFRYKYIEALAQIPDCYPVLETLLKEEKHLYIRWYAEKYGFGYDTFTH